MQIQRLLTVLAMLCGLMVAGRSAIAGATETTISEEMKIVVEIEIEAPVAYYDFDGKTLAWRDVAENDSHYMRVSMRDSVGGIVSGAAVNAAVLSLKDKVIGTSITLHDTWDQDRAHYGANLQLPDDLTSGNVVVRIEPGKGRRLGRGDGDFFTKPVTIRFDGLDFEKVKAAKPVKRRGTQADGGQAEGKTTEPDRVEWPAGRRPYVTPTPYPGAKPLVN